MKPAPGYLTAWMNWSLSTFLQEGNSADFCWWGQKRDNPCEPKNMYDINSEIINVKFNKIVLDHNHWSDCLLFYFSWILVRSKSRLWRLKMNLWSLKVTLLIFIINIFLCPTDWLKFQIAYDKNLARRFTLFTICKSVGFNIATNIIL